MDGVTAVKQIRKTEQSSSLAKQTVIALTGNARQERIDQALAAGMDDGAFRVPGNVSGSV
jgi:CheY-like chemotaxis protein